MGIIAFNSITVSLSLALPLAAAVILCVWIAYGQSRWGLRTGTGVLLIALFWEILLRLSTTFSMSKTSASLVLLSVSAGTLMICYFIEWLDIRFCNLFDSSKAHSRANASLNLVDLLFLTFSFAVVIAILGKHAFYDISEAALMLALGQGVLLAIVSLTILWAVISGTNAKIRLLILILGSFLVIWLTELVLTTNSIRPRWPPPLLTLSFSMVVLAYSALMRFCGYRFVIPEDPTEQDGSR